MARRAEMSASIPRDLAVVRLRFAMSVIRTAAPVTSGCDIEDIEMARSACRRISAREMLRAGLCVSEHHDHLNGSVRRVKSCRRSMASPQLVPTGHLYVTIWTGGVPLPYSSPPVLAQP